jgi:hypothetical protein
MKLNKRAKSLMNGELVEMNFNRKCFTKHGLHLNNAGKEELAKVVALQINKIINYTSNDNLVIPLRWIEEPINKSFIGNSTHPLNGNTAMDNLPRLDIPQTRSHGNQLELIAPDSARRTSARQKKATINRHNDFLC